MLEQDRIAAKQCHRPEDAHPTSLSSCFRHLPRGRRTRGAMADGISPLKRPHEGRLRCQTACLISRTLQTVSSCSQPVTHPYRGPLLDVQMLPLRHPPRDASSISLLTGLPLPQQSPLRAELGLSRKDLQPVVHSSKRVLTRA